MIEKERSRDIFEQLQYGNNLNYGDGYSDPRGPRRPERNLDILDNLVSENQYVKFKDQAWKQDQYNLASRVDRQLTELYLPSNELAL